MTSRTLVHPIRPKRRADLRPDRRLHRPDAAGRRVPADRRVEPGACRRNVKHSWSQTKVRWSSASTSLSSTGGGHGKIERRKRRRREREAHEQAVHEGAAQAPGRAVSPPGVGEAQGPARDRRVRGAGWGRQGRDDPRDHGTRQPARVPRRRAAGTLRPREVADVHAALHGALPGGGRDRDLRPLVGDVVGVFEVRWRITM